MVEVVLPDDANPLGFILGGRVMHLIDIAAAIACHRHTRSLLVTAAVDGVAIDREGRRVPVPPLLLDTDADRARAAAALERREARLALRARAQGAETAAPPDSASGGRA
jgi:acyl-CoA hydrolase